MIPPDSVKRKLDGVVESVPPDRDCEVFDGELTHEMKLIVKVLLIVMMLKFC